MAIFHTETRLWNPIAGWQTFPAGEQHPGDAWSSTEGGSPDGTKTQSSTLAELSAATSRAEAAERRIAGLEHDCAQRAQERDDANAKIADLQRRADEAEANVVALQADKDRLAAEVTAARDAEGLARNDQAAARQAADEAAATVVRLTAELEAAHQTIADQNGQIEALTAPQSGDATSGKSKKAGDAPQDAAQADPAA